MGGKVFGEAAVFGEEEKMKSNLTRLASHLLLITVLSGCGYTTRSMISNEFKTIYITPFVNKIDITQEADTGNKYKLYRPHLETTVTRVVIDKYLFDGNLRPTDLTSADLALKAELIEFRRDPLRYDDNDEVEEYRVSVRVRMSLWNNRKNETAWEEDNFGGEATYFTAGHTGAKSEEAAVNEAIADLARRIVERTVEEW